MSSHAVSRAPCRSGRVSSTSTRGVFACRDRGADDAERGAEADGRERAGVAVREHRAPSGRARRRARRGRGCAATSRRRSPRHAPVPRRRRRPRTRQRRVDSPGEVHRGRVARPSGRRRRRRPSSPSARRAARATPNAPRAPSAGAPRTARSAIAVDDLLDSPAVDDDQLAGQPALVDQPHRAVRHATVGGIGSSGPGVT